MPRGRHQITRRCGRHERRRLGIRGALGNETAPERRPASVSSIWRELKVTSKTAFHVVDFAKLTSVSHVAVNYAFRTVQTLIVTHPFLIFRFFNPLITLKSPVSPLDPDVAVIRHVVGESRETPSGRRRSRKTGHGYSLRAKVETLCAEKTD